MSQKKTYTHVRADGSTVRVTVPEDPRPEELLIDALRDNLSPEAVTVISAYLQPACCRDAKVSREVQWFQEIVIQALGGPEQFNRIAEEIGL